MSGNNVYKEIKDFRDVLNDRLVTECTNGNLANVQHLITIPGIDLGYHNGLCFTKAVINGHTDIVKRLLFERDLRTQVSLDDAFFVSCDLGHVEIVKFLVTINNALELLLNLDKGLIQASGNGHLPVVSFLLSLDEIEPSTDDNEAFVLAAEGNHVDVARLLYDSGQLKLSHKQLNEIFRLCATYGRDNMLRYLVTLPGVQPASSHNVAFQGAAKYGHISTMKLLLEMTDVNAGDNNNKAIIDVCERGQRNSLEFLVESCHIDASVNDNAPLITACQYNHLDCVKYLLTQRGVSPEGKPMVVAARYGALQVLQHLVLVCKCDITANENAALEWACCESQTKVVKFILEQPGVKVDDRSIRFAKSGRNIKILQMLQSHQLQHSYTVVESQTHKE